MICDMELLSHPLVKKAAEFAKTKHAHQKRLDGKTPYFAHLEGVARIIAEVYPDPETIAAGYLHDTIEDTNTDYDKLETRFGQKVADMVSALTMDNRLPEAERLLEYRNRLRAAPLETAVVKVADILQNAQSLGDNVTRALPDFERKVLAKWKATLDVLFNAKAGDASKEDVLHAFLTLHNRASEILVKRAEAIGVPV